MSGSYVGEIPASVSSLQEGVAQWPYSISEPPYGREHVELQGAMATASYGERHGLYYSNDAYIEGEEDPAKPGVRRRVYLYDYITEVGEAPLSASPLSADYAKWFTTSKAMVAEGEAVGMSSYLMGLSSAYAATTVGSARAQGSLRANAQVKARTLEILSFIIRNLVVRDFGVQFVFTSPTIGEGESVVNTYEHGRVGAHTDGRLPNIKGNFGGAGRSGYSSYADGKLFQENSVWSSSIRASGTNRALISAQKVTFNARNSSPVYDDAANGVLPAGCFAKAIMRIK